MAKDTSKHIKFSLPKYIMLLDSRYDYLYGYIGVLYLSMYLFF